MFYLVEANLTQIYHEWIAALRSQRREAMTRGLPSGGVVDRGSGPAMTARGGSVVVP